MNINGMVDFMCDNGGRITFSKIDGRPNIVASVSIMSYGGMPLEINSVGSTLEDAVKDLPQAVERGKKRPEWKYK